MLVIRSWEINCDWDQRHWGEIIWEVFPPGRHREAVFHRQPRLYAALPPEPTGIRVTQVVLVLKVWREHWGQLRLGTVRDQEKPLAKVQAQWYLNTQDWKGYAEKMRFGTIRRAWERLLVKVQPGCNRRPLHFGDASSMGGPPRTAAAMERSPSEPRRQECVCWRGPSQRSDPGSLELPRWPWANSRVLYVVIGLLCFDLIDCGLILPSWTVKVFNLFLILWEPTVERHWILKDLEF